jgi:hypothetical protein
MRSVPTRILFGGCLAAALLFAGAAQAQTTLRYKFKAGEKKVYETTQKMTMKMNVNGMDVNIGMNTKMTMEQAVTGTTADGKGKITQKFQRIAFDMTTPTANIQYDSEKNKNPDDPAGKIMAPMFNALVNGEFKLIMAPDGSISDMEIPESVTKAMQKLAQGPGGPGLGEMFSKEGLKKIFSQNVSFPTGPVEKGKSWESKTELKLPFGKMEVATKYTYEGPTKEGSKTLEKITTSPTSTVTADPNAPITIAIKKQDAKGTILFDNEAGRMVQSNIESSMQMEITANGMTFTQNVQQTTNLKLLDKGS